MKYFPYILVEISFLYNFYSIAMKSMPKLIKNTGSPYFKVFAGYICPALGMLSISSAAHFYKGELFPAPPLYIWMICGALGGLFLGCFRYYRNNRKD